MEEFSFRSHQPSSSSNGAGDRRGGAQGNNYDPFTIAPAVCADSIFSTYGSTGAKENNYDQFARCSQGPVAPMFQADPIFNTSSLHPSQPINRAHITFRTPYRMTNTAAPPTQPWLINSFRPSHVTRTTPELSPATSNNASLPVHPVFRQQPTLSPSQEPESNPTHTVGPAFPTSIQIQPPTTSSPQVRTGGVTTSGDGVKHNLRAVTEIPEQYQSVFKLFPYFNIVQSKVMDDVLHSDKSVVVSAPTGSGKTVIFELAIIRLLNTMAATSDDYKIIYMAPIKALCSERFQDWQEKFQKFGVRCAELTGDTEIESYNHFQNINMIFTTPEKWDSTTRRWRDNRYLVKLVKLFLIDEIHILNDLGRGATVEAVISRMLTLHMTNSNASSNGYGRSEQVLEPDRGTGIRFLAVSATIPNTQDFADWLGSAGNQSICYKLSEDLRPVKLTKEVLGYPCSPKLSDFRFDMSLSYRVAAVIDKHAHGKPTLIFCSTRKGVIQTCGILAKEGKVKVPVQLKLKLQTKECALRDEKLKESVLKGVGYHHAGLDHNDRRVIEHLFLYGDLPVLTATSTLAMGVNLPAHLVIIKSTVFYAAGSVFEYSDSQILQMIGRAGRPQFDTEATAVIMTRHNLKNKYTNFLNGTELIESSLHTNLAEYLNAEIVLQTITDMPLAMQWIKSTFLYVRVAKKPKHYGLPEGLTVHQTEHKLQEMCKEALNSLVAAQLIEMDDDEFYLNATEAGRLMARYCVSLDTMKKFKELPNVETISDLIAMIASCKELSDVQLRASEKKDLNTMNKDKHLQTIRYPLEGKIKTREMKTNCLIQAVFGCITIQDFTLNQETTRIMKIGQRLAKCLSEYVIGRNKFKEYISCVILAKCFHAKLWENSNYVAKQIEKIGITMSHALVNSGLTTFQKIVDTNPRQLELLVNRHAPFGNHIRKAIAVLPKYEITVEQTSKHSENTAEINFTIQMKRYGDGPEVDTTISGNFPAMLVVGDRDNNVLLKQRLVKSSFDENCKWHRHLKVTRSTNGIDLTIKLISEQYVGLDVEKKFSPVYLGGNRVNKRLMLTKPDPKREPRTTHIDEDYGDLDELPDLFPAPTKRNDVVVLEQADTPGIRHPARRMCSHKCSNKNTCAHECCKTGVSVKTTGAAGKTANAPGSTEKKSKNKLTNFTNELHKKMDDLPPVEYMSKLPWKNKSSVKPSGPGMLSLKKFAYVKPRQVTPSESTAETNPSTQSPMESDLLYNSCPPLSDADEESTKGEIGGWLAEARSGGTLKRFLGRPNFDLLSSQEEWSDLEDATEGVKPPTVIFSPPLLNSSCIDEDTDLLLEELTANDFNDLPTKVSLQAPPPADIPKSTNQMENDSGHWQLIDFVSKSTAGLSMVQTLMEKIKASQSSANINLSNHAEIKSGEGDASNYYHSQLANYHHSTYMDVDLTAEDFQSSPKPSSTAWNVNRARPNAGDIKYIPKYNSAFPWSSAPPLGSTKTAWAGQASKPVNDKSSSFTTKRSVQTNFVSAKNLYLSDVDRKRALDEEELKSDHGDYKRQTTIGQPTLSVFQQHQLQMPRNQTKNKHIQTIPEHPVPITSMSRRVTNSICQVPKLAASVPSRIPVQEPTPLCNVFPWTQDQFKLPVSQQPARQPNMVEINEALDALRSILGED